VINNYNKIAKHYDFLSRLVFGQSQVIAQKNQLKYIKDNSTILIVGGGTGWILTEIAQLHLTGLKITFVEISSKMIELSMNRDRGSNQVTFITSRIEDFHSDERFDVIFTPFLFDNFSEDRCVQVFNQLNHNLNKNGLWLFVDFTIASTGSNWWKKLFLKAMYAFFKIICNVEARKLINLQPYFINENYKKLEERFYYQHFIKAIVYQK